MGHTALIETASHWINDQNRCDNLAIISHSLESQNQLSKEKARTRSANTSALSREITDRRKTALTHFLASS